MNDEDPMRDAVLRAMLPHVARLGWTPAALSAGLRDAGQPAAAGAGLFPRGMPGVVAQFAMLADREMVAAAGPLEGLRTPARIRALILARLAWLEPWRDAERRAVGLLALPWNAAAGGAILARTADSLWLAAGDDSTGFSRHSKRVTLGSVYAATLAFWLRDPAPAPGATAAFLDRRLDQVAQLGRRLRRTT
ncbi:COQ9 family protein [Roseomonas haemaphysalidis]|uniref:COQ9 family protein n=1 Tax=Roseomonas haemaphysalidis TaxID=2768162 RepID=A0ABS3KNX8_9PROT|nr:COQ9 family protein [Roseomonas haemaphysalidis]MBO1079151.1 COQ9 family protein [Roseomonas haemaphysalidis]